MEPIKSKSALACCAAWLLCSSLAARAQAADDDARHCIAAHFEGQDLRSRGALMAAKARFSACSLGRCPQLVRDECEALADAVEAAQPSVVLAAMTEQGQNIRQGTVVIDSSPTAQPLSEAEVVLDPGRHEFTFTLSDGKTHTLNVLLQEGERRRRVEVRFPSAPEEASKSFGVTRPHPIVYVLGAFGALALGSSAYFAIDGRKYEDRLDDCSPNCNRAQAQADFDTMRSRYLLADVSLGVAAASIGLGAYFLLRPPDTSIRMAPARAQSPAIELSAGISPGSVACVASGRF